MVVLFTGFYYWYLFCRIQQKHSAFESYDERQQAAVVQLKRHRRRIHLHRGAWTPFNIQTPPGVWDSSSGNISNMFEKRRQWENLPPTHGFYLETVSKKIDGWPATVKLKPSNPAPPSLLHKFPLNVEFYLKLCLHVCISKKLMAFSKAPFCGGEDHSENSTPAPPSPAKSLSVIVHNQHTANQYNILPINTRVFFPI